MFKNESFGKMFTTVFVITSSILLSIVCVLLFISFVFTNPIELVFAQTHGVFVQTPQPLNDEEWIGLSELIMNGRILSSHDLVAQVSAFYVTIINTLIALIAGLGIVAFMYIKSKSVDVIDDTTKARVDEYFEKIVFNEKIDEKVAHIIVKRVDAAKEDNDFLMEAISERVETLEGRIEAIEYDEGTSDTLIDKQVAQ